MSTDTYYPRRAFWNRVINTPPQAAPQAPLHLEYTETTTPTHPVSPHLLSPNRDADIHRVPDPDYFEPPEDYDR